MPRTADFVQPTTVLPTAPAPVQSLSIPSTSFPAPVVGVPYNHPMPAPVGSPVDPLTWSMTGPDGLTIDAHTGVISGTPTTAGQSQFHVTVEDSSS